LGVGKGLSSTHCQKKKKKKKKKLVGVACTTNTPVPREVGGTPSPWPNRYSTMTVV